jgi:hypothetical protein
VLQQLRTRPVPQSGAPGWWRVSAKKEQVFGSPIAYNEVPESSATRYKSTQHKNLRKPMCQIGPKPGRSKPTHNQTKAHLARQSKRPARSSDASKSAIDARMSADVMRYECNTVPSDPRIKCNVLTLGTPLASSWAARHDNKLPFRLEN